MNNVELSTGRTVHLFDGDQAYDRSFRSLCGRTYDPSLTKVPHGEPVCVTCINVENAREDKE